MSQLLPEYLAAVDLGSNSFHMVIARLVHGQLQIVDKLNDMVRLASGLTPDKQLDAAVAAQALECLRIFSQRLRDLPPQAVRAAGTSTLRRINDHGAFLAAAEKALGHPIEVVSGVEEARLIYLGVSHSLAPTDDSAQRLVIDIGGGSTELIIGRGASTLALESVHIGCVELTRRCFGEGQLDRKQLERAAVVVRQALQPVKQALLDIGWGEVVGSSGSILTVGEIGQRLDGATEIDTSTMDAIRRRIVRARRIEALELPGLSARRQPVFAAGFCILDTVMGELGIERLSCSDGALKEGLLYDLLGRFADQDVRESTVASLSRRFNLNEKQSIRVEGTALRLFDQIAATWGVQGDQPRKLLRWGARLHEIGLAISHTRHHHHGAYLVRSCDLAGFSQQDQLVLAILVQSHRKRLLDAYFADLPERDRDWVRRLAVILRLAALLHRGYRAIELPGLKITAGESRLRLRFERGWLGRNPLTRADLQQEADYLRQIGITLEFE